MIAILALCLAQAPDAGFLKTYCLTCHSEAEKKGELSLEPLLTADPTGRHARLWRKVAEAIDTAEMPPKEAKQPAKADLLAFRKAVTVRLDAMARASAGDPGQVVLRRLNNAEYTYTIRDLTGVPLDPVRQFPADNAAGEGFTNTGDAMAMSPALLGKYLDAAKDISRHAVLLPDGMAFSPHVSQRDWTEEKLAAIRALYSKYTTTVGGTAVNLQGIQFDTNAGGRLPLEAYLAATLAQRKELESGAKSIAQVAAERNLNPKYLGTLWKALTAKEPSLVLDQVRARWQKAGPADAAAVASVVTPWQQSLWRFTTVGHIGKRDGPKAWQVPVIPLTNRQEFRLKLTPPADGSDLVLYLTASDAGDGDAHDLVAWENPRFVAPGRADLSLREVREASRALASRRAVVAQTAQACLKAAAQAPANPDAKAIDALARTNSVPPDLLAAWFEVLGIGGGPAKVDGHMTQKSANSQNYDFIKGWVGADALSVVANSSNTTVRVPGTMKGHGVAVHPAPTRRVVISWQSPIADTVKAEALVRHAHPECGNGVTWTLEVRRGTTRQRLATGIAHGANDVKIGPFAGIEVQAGDLVSMIIGPRDGNHSCDLTAVDLAILGSNPSRAWDLAKDVSPDILAGNPHADRQGNPAVWHFHSESDNGGGAGPVIPAGSLLARWRAASTAESKSTLAADMQNLLKQAPATPAPVASDILLRRDLLAPTGPLVRAAAKLNASAPATTGDNSLVGLDPALFGKHPAGGKPLAPQTLAMKAPSVVEVRLPADLISGCEFVATGVLLDAEGSAQLRATTTRPEGINALAPGGSRPVAGASTWSDGEKGLAYADPILVAEASAARKRITADFEAFRNLFPIALCYSKIVPVDEVVTLTLFYREDDQLRRLMLDDSQAAELDRLWKEFHFVSHDALKLVDAFEQLWQFATQDADPSAFTPMREPIKARAAEFRKELVAAEPKHVDAVVALADRAWRRTLSAGEKDKLRGLYRSLRDQELPHDEAIRLVLARVLAAPSFLYRLENPVAGTKSGSVSGIEQATRLSYFLWSSAPDKELMDLATAGKLADPAVLASQARRMLADPRASRLSAEFGLQWLHLYAFEKTDEKSPRHFPSFGALKGAMREETVLFLNDIVTRDRSILDLIDADYTYLNGDLAKHYGIPGVDGPAWRRVEGTRKHGRGGILTLAATLSQQSGASRTSPVLRGNWVSEVLLGEKLPKPPKNVPQLPEDESETAGLTVRQLVEKHAADPRCAVCHQRIDPIGYSLEGYDAIGRLRTRDLANRAIDTHAKLKDGTELDGLDGLRRLLTATRRDAFVRQFCRKLLGYALGRGTQLADEPLLDRMVKRLEANGYRIGEAVAEIVTSQPFREIRGRDVPSDN